jgi:periplasmic protein TonB
VKEVYAGILASVAFHACVISFFAGISIGLQGVHKPVKTVVLDFTLLKGHESVGRDASGAAGKAEGKGGGDGPARRDTAKLTATSATQPQSVSRPMQLPEMGQASPVATRKAGSISDPEGSVAVQGDVAGIGSRAGVYGVGVAGGSGTGTGTKEVSPGGGTGQGGGAGTGGEGIQGGKDYFYIRDRVLRNVKYPEKARRMGTEGQVLLSFIVLENGATSEVKVVRSSGSRVLDDDAKEAVVRTRIDRTVPYRAVVSLPITYTLH